MNIPKNEKYLWLPLLYDYIKILKPKKIIEFGPGKGSTTITMATALKDNNIDGKINSYDLWVNEHWGDYEKSMAEFKNWGVQEYINLEKKIFMNG
jgi:tRNA A58 N-methylase Trm61